MNKKGFTLIELLIVIGIISILATAVVLVLNPAQLLAQARDSTRISDLGSVKSAIGLYLATATSTDVNFGGSGTACRVSNTLVTPLSGIFSTTCTVTASSTVDGNGWVNVKLSDTTGGSALGILPKDPTNSATYFYAYSGDDVNSTFELDTALESIKYIGMMANSIDGGNNPTYYEVGTDPGLDL